MSKKNENKLLPKFRFPEFNNDGEWEVKKLDEIAEIKRGAASQHLKYVDKNHPNAIRLLRINDFLNDDAVYVEDTPDMKRFRVKTTDILIAGTGATAGITFIVESKFNDLAYSYNAPRIRVKNINSQFVYHYLKSDSIIQQQKRFFVGNAQPFLDTTAIGNLKIFISSSNEQQKIAACLSTLDEVITAESHKLEVLKDHKRGLLQNILPVGKETIPKLRFKEFQNADEWNEDTLANIASFRRGSFPQPYGLPKWYDDENGMPFIQVFDVGEDFRLKPTTKRKISSLAAEQSVFIPIGTLIITIQGSIGRVAITQYDAYIDRTLLLFEEFYQEVDITFFAYTIFLLFEIEKQKAPGGIIKTITKEVLSSFVVKLPSIEEQQKIASSLTSLDELISAQTEKIESLQFHKKGLLQGLFPNVNEVTE